MAVKDKCDVCNEFKELMLYQGKWCCKNCWIGDKGVWKKSDKKQNAKMYIL